MKTEIFQYRWNMLQTEHNSVWLCYDSKNMNTDADGIEMAEFGHAKDDEDRPQVNISCAVDQESGTPLFYEMYPGSIIDNTQCTYMVDRAKEYGYKNAGLILDRGYFSTQNIRYFDQKGYDFLLNENRQQGAGRISGRSDSAAGYENEVLSAESQCVWIDRNRKTRR